MATQPSFDTLVVGAGYAGSIMAERLATECGQRVLVIDRRDHIAGNAYDYLDEHGLLCHRYGPHIFHTQSQKVVDYLSRFTEWRPYEHRVLARVEDKLLPMPINRDTVNRLYDLELDSEEAMERFLAERAEPRERIENSEDTVVAKVGRDLYEKPPAHRGQDLHRLRSRRRRDRLRPPRLHRARGCLLRLPLRRAPHRSLEFEHFNEPTPDGGLVQPVASINFPSEDVPYTRTTEYRHLTGQSHRSSTIAREFPRAEGDPYYPVPNSENRELYKRYEALAEADSHVTFAGRLARYQYLNMDQVTAQALSTFERLLESGRLAA